VRRAQDRGLMKKLILTISIMLTGISLLADRTAFIQAFSITILTNPVIVVEEEIIE